MTRPLLPFLIAVTCGVSLLSAQRPGGGMTERGGGARPGMVRGRMPEPPSRDLIAGPYAPDSMIHKFVLDTVQGPRYRAAWDSMMAATRPARDSIREAMGGLQRARGEGYQREGERRAAEIRRLGKRLKQEEERFDKVVRRILTDDQWDDFKDWRERRRETEQELQRRNMEEGMGRRRPRG